MDTATRAREVMDGNEAAARMAYALSEVIAIYPITPASPMGEWADAWASAGRPNLWGTVPQVVEMQSEGGAAGAVHGAASTGSLATTFTASQGLLLMIPNMYKLAGELSPVVIHVAARTVATHALSIFGDHSDVMAARQTGFAMLASGSPQEAMDLALVAHAAALETRLPFLHFFDGFRTSHEEATLEPLAEADLRALVGDDLLLAHRRRALTPDRPSLRGSAQNPDVYFQAREAVAPFYLEAPAVVQRIMEQLGERTGRPYGLFDYVGSPTARRVIVMMGSGAGAVEEAIEALDAKGQEVGLVKVRLYRPFSAAHLAAALPKTVEAIAVLDRTKEPGAPGEPLYLDVSAALDQALARGTAPFARRPKVIGGRYGLASKEFTPGMAAAVYAELAREIPKNPFTVGIVDDVGGTSLAWDRSFAPEPPDVFRAILFGLGSDGTVGAAKSTIKLAAKASGGHAQGYFVYDSKKSGSATASHLRFSPRPIRSTYLVSAAAFVACHHESLLERLDVLEAAAPGATFLLNTTAPAGEIWGRLPGRVRRALVQKKLRFFIVDAYKTAREAGLGGRINTVMQTCFLHLTGLVPDPAAAVKAAAAEAYGGKGEGVVERNLRAVDQALNRLREVPVPAEAGAAGDGESPVPAEAPEFVRRVTSRLLAGQGDLLPVSAMPVDGTFPTGTARFEKRNLAAEIPAWEPDVCIQCNKCALVCPHAAIRVKAYPESALANAPPTFKSAPWRGREFPEGTLYSVQTAPEDCTGCGLCVEICPAVSKAGDGLRAVHMEPQAPLREGERRNFEFFLGLPEADRRLVKPATVKGSQLLQPLFEFSGACAGCGETPYLKLLTQLFGDRLLVANATGCSSIYGGNLPTTPWTLNPEGRGPAWANSLFEDNAEFGLGFRLSLDKQRERAGELLRAHAAQAGEKLAGELLAAGQEGEEGLAAQRSRVEALKKKLRRVREPWARDLLSLADSLVRKSVWIVGGDGWAYDIGFGGLDHVLNSGRNVKVLVLDTEVYSNTGGQASKATPRGAVARFAASGKATPRKDLALICMTYEGVYVAQIALGGGDTQAVKALAEADAYDGPAIVIAYSHCIAHGIDMVKGLDQHRLAVQSGSWPLLRFDPRRAAQGQNPLQLDSPPPRFKVEDYAYREARYKTLADAHPKEAARLMREAQADVDLMWRRLQDLARPWNSAKT